MHLDASIEETLDMQCDLVNVRGGVIGCSIARDLVVPLRTVSKHGSKS